MRGERLGVGSDSPGLAAHVSFYGLYLYNLGQTEIWPDPRANAEHTMDVLERLRQGLPHQTSKLLWDGASYHRAGAVREQAARLDIELIDRVEALPADDQYRSLSGRGSSLGQGCPRS